MTELRGSESAVSGPLRAVLLWIALSDGGALSCARPRRNQGSEPRFPKAKLYCTEPTGDRALPLAEFVQPGRRAQLLARAASALPGVGAVDVPVAADGGVPAHGVLRLARREHEAADHSLPALEVA